MLACISPDSPNKLELYINEDESATVKFALFAKETSRIRIIIRIFY